MERKVKSFRLRVDLLEWVESYAASRKSSQIAVLETALEQMRDLSQGGVPDLPVDEPVGGKVVVSPAPVTRQETSVDWAMARQVKLNEAKYRRTS